MVQPEVDTAIVLYAEGDRAADDELRNHFLFLENGCHKFEAPCVGLLK